MMSSQQTTVVDDLRLAGVPGELAPGILDTFWVFGTGPLCLGVWYRVTLILSKDESITIDYEVCDGRASRDVSEE